MSYPLFNMYYRNMKFLTVYQRAIIKKKGLDIKNIKTRKKPGTLYVLKYLYEKPTVNELYLVCSIFAEKDFRQAWISISAYFYTNMKSI